jgi:hypothetical protein
LSCTCPTGQEVYGVRKDAPCPGLSFEDGQATCEIAEAGNYEIIGVGLGCCIKARALAKGVTYDFAMLPPHIKRALAQEAR